ncbi:MAG: phenylalanine--tRNA ligase subunit alpha [Atribacterota bacterium]|nr:phenylalanine--tRNA ligase subunit alpha [Atribacterota bacterium]MDI9596429.1 phenylalanine--tRNA ligase subunit alpha [Atribacterota bacterium]
MIEKIIKLRKQFDDDISLKKDTDEIEKLKNEYLGRKGYIAKMLKEISLLPKDERPKIGQLLNKAKKEIQKIVSEKENISLTKKKKTEDIFDITIPGKTFKIGSLHPIELILRKTQEIFLGMGFNFVDGPEIELDYYNFEGLNIPKDHPARDDQDSFYITTEILLRTQTSPMQVRTMENQPPPIRMISTGKCYRRDAIDSTHSPMFYQIEGLAVDKGIRFSDLKGVITEFCQQIFGKDRKVRFRPGYFPFVEPGAEVDVSCGLCEGKGCRSCGYTGWLEIMGAGMVHPNVLEMAGYDSKKLTGFAFGMGAERIAMLKYGINDIRLFFENDIRFLKQFK